MQPTDFDMGRLNIRENTTLQIFVTWDFWEELHAMLGIVYTTTEMLYAVAHDEIISAKHAIVALHLGEYRLGIGDSVL